MFVEPRPCDNQRAKKGEEDVMILQLLVSVVSVGNGGIPSTGGQRGGRGFANDKAIQITCLENISNLSVPGMMVI